MNELWVSKRREEAFQWKAKQQLTLMLDRMSLHRSRLESDLLMRHETADYLRGADTRPKSAVLRRNSPDNSPRSPDGAQTARAASAGFQNRFAPIVDSSARKRRILSGRISARERAGKYATASSGEEDDDLDIVEDNGDDDDDDGGMAEALKEYEEGNSLKEHGVTKVEVGDKTLVQTIRKDVKKAQKGGNIPFRFSSALPLSYKHEFYMELSSSDEDDDDDDEEGGNLRQRRAQSAPGGGTLASTGGMGMTGGGATGDAAKKKPKSAGAGKKGASGPVVKVMFKHEKPENHDRPVSGALFRSMAEADPEFKVMYRHTNFRRMPLTARQEKWLEDRESERVKISYEMAKKLVEDEAAKANKKKEKGDKDGKGKDKDKDKKSKEKEKKAKEEAAKKAASAKPPPPKYRSASHFMSINFPNFDGDEEEDRVESCGPMKITQMAEVERVLDAFGRVDMPINESVVRKALVIPQDLPDAVCQEGIRETSLEGLMLNPLPPEFWKISGKAKKGKKGGGGGKKKKKK